MFMPRLLAFLFLVLVSPSFLSGQFMREEATLFSSRSDAYDPVKLTVDQSDYGVLKFIATNDTYYPFIVKINFNKMDNFTAVFRTREALVRNGKNTLFELQIKDPESGYSLDYDFSYVPGKPEAANETDFIYLVPLKSGTLPEAGMKGGTGILDSFALHEGDTVYCSRKGTVVALPGDMRNQFRITGTDALEILHDDGTIMIYSGLAGGALNLSPGMTVYPGDPIVVAAGSTTLILHLVALVPAEKLPSLPILYAVDDTIGAQYSRIEGRIRVIHPESLITKEMTTREIKQRVKKKSRGQ